MWIPLRRTRILTALVLLALAVPTDARGSKVLRVDGAKALTQGTLDGVVLTPRGTLRPGVRHDALDLKAPTAWAALAHGHATWFGTGNRGEVLRLAEDNTLTRIAAAPDGLMVTALAGLPGGAIAAAIAPGGRLVRIDAEGAVTALAEVEATYVWALEGQEDGSLVVATGGPAQLITLDPLGAVDARVELPDTHARCLLRHEDGWLVGTAPQGRVVQVAGPTVRVLRDLDVQEVVGLAPHPSGGWYIAANQDVAGGNAQTLGNLLRQVVEPAPTAPGATPPARVAVQDGRLLHLETTGVVTPLWSGSKQAVRTLAAFGGDAWLGIEPGGRVLRIAPEGGVTVHADLPSAEVSAFVRLVDAPPLPVTSNPAAFHTPQRDAATMPTWTSAVLDAGAPATWGVVHGHGAEGVHLEVRAGETTPPDGTWSDWQTAAADAPCGARGRHLQIRARFDGPDARLRGVSVGLVTPNAAPRISELRVQIPGRKADAPPTANAAREITWKIEDPDGDRLHTTVRVRRRGSTRWHVLVDDAALDAPKHTWDTAGWPDGTYDVEVEAHDAASRGDAQARRHLQEVGPVRVDNTAPRITFGVFSVDGRESLVATVQDTQDGRVHSAEIAVDGGPWRPLAPDDGIYDQAQEVLQHVLPPGPVDIVLRVRDDLGNVGAATWVRE